jgi:hypothetical protein
MLIVSDICAFIIRYRYFINPKPYTEAASDDAD